MIARYPVFVLGAFIFLAAFLNPVTSPSLAAQMPVASGGGVLGEEEVSTFSIIAFDPETQELGIGVQSRAFRAGAIVSWAEAGIGAVATQAAANQLYKQRALELLREGRTPQEAVDIMTQEDPGRDVRQVAVIDVQGRIGVHTGADRVARPNQFAGHIVGENYSVQGNTLAGAWVLTEMARAYEETDGTMGERLLASLVAGEEAGGDVRGMQAGSILVVRPLDGNRTTDRWVDIRVDDADDPYVELKRLLDMSMSGDQADRATELWSQERRSEAIPALKRAIEMNPRRDNWVFQLSEWYAEIGQDRAALNTLREAIRTDPQWKAAALESAAFARFRGEAEFQQVTRD
jgi:uncharacterized Ntn-hydrolase superfamily protein